MPALGGKDAASEPQLSSAIQKVESTDEQRRVSAREAAMSARTVSLPTVPLEAYEEKQRECLALKRRVDELSTALETTKSQGKENSDVLAELQDLCRAVERQRDAFADELEQAEKEIDGMKSEIEKLRVPSVCSRCDSKGAQSEAASATSAVKIAALQKELDSKAAELASVKRATEVIRQRADAQLLEQDLELSGLREQIKDLTDELAAARKPPAPAATPPPVTKQLSRMKSIRASIGLGSAIDSAGVGEPDVQKIHLENAALWEAERSALVSEINNLRSKLALMETELDASEHREFNLIAEVQKIRSELWEALDKIDAINSAQKIQPADNLANSKSINAEGAEKASAKENAMGNSIDPAAHQSLIEANASLLSDLILLKIDYANMAGEKDQDLLKLFQLKRRMQAYAERVGVLEVQLALLEEKNKIVQTAEKPEATDSSVAQQHQEDSKNNSSS